ncbi:dihydrodipicolinate synthetase family protein [Akanthomyces lecanii RCEF 1005]|uniref:Dihydrodipicolinate synthetase family protein n=1 Tax=Akanthomyces lecanii RCEF 1005 TaxID=1081108 RepID=A0A168JFF1_CORDF|nr:dihydrodipicolinate synthetase family protein [Akanthomyces lecanii RCEF 1005]
MSAPPPGIYVPIPTFFAARASAAYNPTTPPLDHDTQAAHAVYLARAGIAGLVVLGSTGEAVHIHPRDRRALLAGLRGALDDAGFPEYPLIAGTATNSVEETVEQLRDAKEAGAQWGMVLVPGYNAPVTPQEGIVAWFRAVADQSPIPILVYHYPGVSNMVKVTPATFATLAQHPNIVGCKLSHGDVSQLTQIASNPAIDGSTFRVFTGLGQQLLPVVSVGCGGAIDGSAGFFPKALVRLFHLSSQQTLSEGELSERRLLQYRVSCMEEIVVRFGIPGIKEAISRLRGFGDKDGTRLPLTGGLPGGDVEWANWKCVLDEMEELEKAL